ncbi:YcfL family protein [Serratia sp. (in: enterobacteria)]|uniref:YcfL family protein n=1 Tax=Serratia sp. (in: enterobacteria) TaxID=616 RepID=UPI003F3BAB22
MRGKKTLRGLMALALPAALLMGCSSPPGIAVNQGQTVVMDPSVLNNSQPTPVTVHYRFYWYDAQGLDIRPFEKPREIVVAPDSDAKIYSINGNLDAKSARLYLYL